MRAERKRRRDASGNKVAESRHYPYGGERWSSVDGGSAFPTDYRWTGQRSDGYIKLYQMGARWYDYYQALRWRHDTLDMSRMKIGLYEALEIADRYGGQEFRESVRDRCVVSIFVSDYEWVIGYKELGQLTWSDLRIQVDAKSGKAKRLPR